MHASTHLAVGPYISISIPLYPFFSFICCRHGVWFIFFTTAVATLACFVAVVRHTSHESGTGAAETLSLPVRLEDADDAQNVECMRTSANVVADLDQQAAISIVSPFVQNLKK